MEHPTVKDLQQAIKTAKAAGVAADEIAVAEDKLKELQEKAEAALAQLKQSSTSGRRAKGRARRSHRAT